jgi:antitoxin component YwqK of YwqJK toxin-antitoxin module
MKQTLLLITFMLLSSGNSQVFRSYSAERSLLEQIHLTKRRHLIRQYREDGSVESEAEYHNDRRDGITREFYPDGVLKAQIYFKNGREHGIARLYYPTGIIKQKITYERGKVKEQHFYDEEGHLIR